jgi:D-lactate dehydrogenase
LAFIELSQNFHFIALTRRALLEFDDFILSKLPLLEGVSAYSTGKEWIDEQAFVKRGIQLKTLPSYCTNAVAETALGLVLMQQHKLHLRYMKAMQKIPSVVSLRGTELIHKGVGIIGFGRIGSHLALKIKPLCHSVFVNDIDESQYQNISEGIVAVSKNEILVQCDIIIFCASQQFLAHEIISQSDYQLLKPNVVMLNIARKSLLDHQLLLEMVKNKQIQGYIYDDLVQDNENPDEVEYGKIIPTGHTAWYTDTAIEHGTETWIQHLLSFKTL